MERCRFRARSMWRRTFFSTQSLMKLFSILYGFWVANQVAFNGDRIRALAEQFLTLAEKQAENAAKAEDYFERALAIARQQQAKSWELRASMSLARLWRDQGKVSKARELLAPVYGWFTEGHGTRDLMEAKALLEELAA
jgi:hypothetical protein